MKAYTDIEQSKKLAEILPIESADMSYVKAYFDGKQSDWFIQAVKPIKFYDVIPAWSLAALLDVIPSGKALIHDKGNRGYKCICNNIDTYFYDNPIDAAFEMIVKLNELNLL